MKMELDKKQVNELSVKFCKRVKAWCEKNNTKYCGDWMIAPCFENVIKEEFCANVGIKK